MMLIPRYSIRWVLGGTIAAGIFFVVVRKATEGSGWAFGIAAGLAGLAVFLAVYAWLFFLIWLISHVFRAIGRGRAPDGRSPFARINP